MLRFPTRAGGAPQNWTCLAALLHVRLPSCHASAPSTNAQQSFATFFASRRQRQEKAIPNARGKLKPLRQNPLSPLSLSGTRHRSKPRGGTPFAHVHGFLHYKSSGSVACFAEFAKDLVSRMGSTVLQMSCLDMPDANIVKNLSFYELQHASDA